MEQSALHDAAALPLPSSQLQAMLHQMAFAVGHIDEAMPGQTSMGVWGSVTPPSSNFYGN